jgi:hypothetical protein
MWMIVFGAGASYDSVSEERWHERVDPDLQPPLTTGLFDQRPIHVKAWTKHEPCAPLVNELWNVARKAEAGGTRSPTVEEYLENLVVKYGTTPRMQQQLMALRFYLHDVIAETTREWVNAHGVNTNYATLLDWMNRIRPEGERVLLVTFNYDPMLDQARRSVFDVPPGDDDSGPRLTYPETYLAGPTMLIRPHGSVDWAHLARRGPGSSAELIEDSPNYRLTERIDRWKGHGQSYGEVPAIAIPTRGKLQFECPSEHVEALRRHLGDVTHVLTIGWRAQEEAFLDLCRDKLNQPVRGLVVSGTIGGAKQTAKHLDTALGSKAHRILPAGVMGFSDFIREGPEQLEGLDALVEEFDIKP